MEEKARSASKKEIMNRFKRWYQRKFLDLWMRLIFKLVRRYVIPAFPPEMQDLIMGDLRRCKECPHTRELHAPKLGCTGFIGYRSCQCTWSGETLQD